jgi:hypothetical protein
MDFKRPVAGFLGGEAANTISVMRFQVDTAPPLLIRLQSDMDALHPDLKQRNRISNSRFS